MVVPNNHDTINNRPIFACCRVVFFALFCCQNKDRESWGGENGDDELGMQQKLVMARAFAGGYKKSKDDPRVKELMKKVRDYNALLKESG